MHPVFHEHIGFFVFFEVKLIFTVISRIGPDRRLILHHALRCGMDALIGSSCHSAQDRSPETGSFRLSRDMHMEHGMGERVRKAVKEQGQGLLGIKSMVDRAWSHEEQDHSHYPKSWCRPFDIETESPYLMVALRYSIWLGADILIPPGNFNHLIFAVEHIDDVLDDPLTEEDRAFLAARLPQVREQPFYDPECYQKQ